MMLGKLLDKILGKEIAFYIKAHRGLVFISLLLTAVAAILTVVPIILVEPFVDEAMKTALEEFRDRVELVFKSKLRETGQEDTFRVQRVVRKDVKPPLQTINAFEQVISASQERDSKKSEAKGDADAIHNDAAGAIAKELVAAIDAYQAVIKTGDVDKIAEAEEKVDLLLSKAGGMASEIITQAEAYRSLIVSEAASDAKRMAELRDLYK